MLAWVPFLPASPHQLLVVLDPGTCFGALITGVGLILLYQLRFLSHLLYHIKSGTSSQSHLIPSTCGLTLALVFVSEALIINIGLILFYQVRFFPTYFTPHPHPLFKMSSPIDLTEELEDQLPPDVLNGWLPIRGKPVFHLFKFSQYPANKTNYTIPCDFIPVLHEDVIMDFDYTTLPQLGPPVNSSVKKAYQAAIKLAKHPVHLITLTPYPGPGDPVTVPTWIFHYWREIESAASYLEQWKAALMWLQLYSELPVTAGRCQEVLMALSFFPWSGNNASVKDITSLFSKRVPRSYLSDFHINYMIERISGQHQDLRGPEFSGRHILATTYLLATITAFYSGPRTPVKAGNLLWNELMGIENQIIQGEVDSVGGVYCFPLHWVSVIFNLQEGSILYGDSFGQPLPCTECGAFTKWVKHLRRRSNLSVGDGSIPVHLLPTGHQNDVTSCGLFALNALRHYYLDHLLLPSNPISLVYNRMEIALDLLHTNTVCLF